MSRGRKSWIPPAGRPRQRRWRPSMQHVNVIQTGAKAVTSDFVTVCSTCVNGTTLRAACSLIIMAALLIRLFGAGALLRCTPSVHSFGALLRGAARGQSGHARASAVSMMSLAPLDRRAALSGAATALLWGVQRSGARSSSTLAVDSAKLTREASKLSAEDAELAMLGRQELSDEVALCQAQDAVLDAMSTKKDPAAIAKLQAKVVELKAKESADAT